MDFTRGMRDKIENHLTIHNDFEVEMSISGSSVYDFCCFGVDANEKLSDDRYMVFYNQTTTPANEIRYCAGNNSGKFTVNLEKLPSTIHKLVFTVSIDGNGTMGQIANHSLTIKQANQNVINMLLSGNDFESEKAIISVEIYRKNEWRIAAIAKGFNGGLSALLKSFGGEEIAPEGQSAAIEAPPVQEAPKPEPAPAPMKISLKKGEKVSLKKNTNMPIIVETGWTAKGKDYDLKALVRYRDGRLIYIGAANADEVLSTPEGAIVHGGDVKNPGELEHIKVSWHPDIASVAVSSYSAIENGTGSFYRYGVFVRIKNGSQTVEIPAADTSANDRSYTLCFGEIIFGDTPDSFEVSALEMYSRPNSENRIGYKKGVVMMDIGPKGRKK